MFGISSVLCVYPPQAFAQTFLAYPAVVLASFLAGLSCACGYRTPYKKLRRAPTHRILNPFLPPLIPFLSFLGLRGSLPTFLTFISASFTQRATLLLSQSDRPLNQICCPLFWLCSSLSWLSLLRSAVDLWSPDVGTISSCGRNRSNSRVLPRPLEASPK